MNETDRIINDLNTAKLMLCNQQTLTPEMCVRIGQAINSAIDLLKDQEAVAPKRIDGKRNHFTKCGNCNHDLMSGYHYCPHCGKAVKWE